MWASGYDWVLVNPTPRLRQSLGFPRRAVYALTRARTDWPSPAVGRIGCHSAKDYSGVFPAAHQALNDAIAGVLKSAPEGIRERVLVKAFSKTPLQAEAQNAAAASTLVVAEHFREGDPGRLGRIRVYG